MVLPISGLTIGALLTLVPAFQVKTCELDESAAMQGGVCDPASAIITITDEDPGTCDDESDPCEWTFNVTIYNVNCTTACGGAFTAYRALTQGTLGGFGNNDWTWSGEFVQLSCTEMQSTVTYKYEVRCGAGDPAGTTKGGWNLTLICKACQ